MTTRLICASHSPLLYCFKKEPADWDALQRTFKEQAAAVNAFDPDLVIAFGSDHFNGFFMKNMPSFCVGFQAEAAGDIGGFPGPLQVPTDIAEKLVVDLRANGVDPAVSHSMTVDHAFSQTIHIMLGGLDKRPIIPIFINCITQPFVPFKRSRQLGETVGCFAQKLGKRVLLLASGGMSHHPTRYYPALGDGEDSVTAWQISGGDDPGSLTKKQWLERLDVMHHEGAEMIARGERTAAQMHLNAEADQRFLKVLIANRLEEFDTWNQSALVAEAGIGSMELHTWIAGAAAHKIAGGNPPELSFYSVTPELGIAAGVVHGE
jgi:2,3-dihydroxyphenylpropionate 1,2-dioxygenase